ncbi:Ku protein [Bacillaceae bacterium SIJ1]|uniref:non-homologous end joining protein Ku n=1 Tax=Litoribacterium kuwaitense TaxID=1398745 RepID=UPI0013EB78E1|nr:Ku protein [Litoribacterium kuwaitense]NGP43751.1 Ku protein [Litoribacterium kuwaitense]
MHTIWKGAISFGLVNIPVKLYKATDSPSIPLRQLHNVCNTPIQYKKHCPTCDIDVSGKDIVKGYEYEKDTFKVVNEETLEKLQSDNSPKAVSIQQFVSVTEIDPVYYHTSYYLGPDATGHKPYALLHEALHETNKAGIATIVLRQKEHLALIRPYDNVLLMETMHFPENLRSTEQVPDLPKETTVSEKELATAEKLIEQLTEPFEPAAFKNTYAERFKDALLNTETMISAGETHKKETNVHDLMKTLQASIDQTQPEQHPPKKQKTARKTKTAPGKKAT